MKKLFLPALVCWPLLAQSATLGLSCSSTVRAGSSLTCSIALSGGALPAGLQWTLGTSAPVGVVLVTPAVATTASQKSVACNAVNTCLVTGINANQIADGVLAILNIPIPAASSGQQMNLSLSGAIAVSLAGTAVTVSVNPPVSVSMFSGCDLNRDGKSDVVDVQIVINAARGLACTAQ